MNKKINYGRKLSQSEIDYLRKLHGNNQQNSNVNMGYTQRQQKNVQKKQYKQMQKNHVLNNKNQIGDNNVNYGREISQSEQIYLNKLQKKNTYTDNSGPNTTSQGFIDNFNKLDKNWKVKFVVISAACLLMFVGVVGANMHSSEQEAKYKKVIAQEHKKRVAAELQVAELQKKMDKEHVDVDITNKQKKVVVEKQEVFEDINEHGSLAGDTVEAQNKDESIDKTLYKVTKVVDGDTISVDIKGTIEKLRLIGIDTPEIVDPRKPVQCFGKEASNKAKELLDGKSVYLEADSTQDERDKYGRLLRYVFLEDGTNFNEKMISDGYAHEYTYRVPYKYQEDFKSVEKDARESEKGLWAEDTCDGDTTQSADKVVEQVTSKVTPTPAPVAKIIETTPVPVSNSEGSYTCNCSKTCPQMSSCAEAQYQLNSCGCSRRDGDKDGIACDSDCE